MNLEGAVKLDRFAELFALVCRYNAKWFDIAEGENGYVHVSISDVGDDLKAKAKELFPQLKISFR